MGIQKTMFAPFGPAVLSDVASATSSRHTAASSVNVSNVQDGVCLICAARQKLVGSMSLYGRLSLTDRAPCWLFKHLTSWSEVVVLQIPDFKTTLPEVVWGHRVLRLHSARKHLTHKDFTEETYLYQQQCLHTVFHFQICVSSARSKIQDVEKDEDPKRQ